MPFIQTELSSIWYREVGNGTPLVLIGGLGAAASTWQTVQRRLSREYRVICPDNPGVGQSALPERDFTVDDIAASMAEVLEALQLDNVLIVGHSMGGCIAANLAATHPQLIAGVVLANTLTRPSEDRALHFENLRQKRHELSLEEWYEIFYAHMLTPRRFSNEAYKEAIVSFALQQPQSDESFLRQMHALLAFDGHEYLETLQQSGIPVLLISSEYDTLIPPQRTFAMMQNPAGAVLLRDAGHASYIENYKDFCSAILTFGGTL